MTLAQDLANVGSGSASKNTLAPTIASLRTQASRIGPLSVITPLTTAATDAQSSLIAYADLLESKNNAYLARLAVTLPLMESVRSLDLKIGSTGADNSFATYFGKVDAINTSAVATLNEAVSRLLYMSTTALTIPGVTGTGDAILVNLVASLPAATAPNPAPPPATIPNPAFTSYLAANSAKFSAMAADLTSLKATVASATSLVSSAYAAMDAAYSAGVNKLRGMALVQFVNGPHASEVSLEITKAINVASLPTLPA